VAREEASVGFGYVVCRCEQHADFGERQSLQESSCDTGGPVGLDECQLLAEAYDGVQARLGCVIDQADLVLLIYAEAAMDDEIITHDRVNHLPVERAVHDVGIELFEGQVP
jgi:hypothetical protein